MKTSGLCHDCLLTAGIDCICSSVDDFFSSTSTPLTKTDIDFLKHEDFMLQLEREGYIK